MKISELKRNLEAIKTTSADNILIYSRISEDDESFKFLSYSSGFDILEFLTNKGVSTVDTGKVLKKSLSEDEMINLRETGFALGLNGVFCVVTQKALIQMCALLGLRGITLAKPSNNRDLLIANNLKQKLYFVYSQGEHPTILGVSTKKYIPNNYFEDVNITLSNYFGYAAFNEFNTKDGIAIWYRYHTKNGITPIIVVRDRVSGPHSYEMEILYDVAGYLITLESYTTTDYKPILHNIIEDYPKYTSLLGHINDYLSLDLNPLKAYSEFLYQKAMDSTLLTLQELISFCKNHNVPSETISQIIKYAVI